ncbi:MULTISPECIES: ATP-binding protein [Streptomyces]|uniref:LuxR family transcriptional regulator n=1 Tax=Streptomyces ramulosus TaxID=47762 RepID=A0ABW1FN20_9ACTN
MIFGREPELRALRDVVDRAARGQGGLLVLRGSSGVGKSTLLAEARTHARARGLAVRSADNGPLDAEIPFGTAHRLLAPEPPGTRTYGPPAGSPGGTPHPDGTPHPGGPAWPARAPAARGDGPGAEVPQPVLHALFRTVARLGADDGALLAVDDLQWCDAASLRWLSYLAHRIEQTPITIVTCLNESEPAADPALVDAVCRAGSRMRIGGLDADATDAWLRSALAGTGPALRQTCHRLTHGNPFLLTELVASFARHGVPADTAALARFTAEGLTRRIRGRLARASDGARALARALTVADDQLDIATLAALADLDVPAAAHAVAELVTAGIVADTARIRFSHTLLRNAVDGTLDPAYRRAAHARAAALLRGTGAPTEAVAAHLVKAGPPGEPWMTRTLAAAATSAHALDAPDVALGFLRHALTGPHPDRSPLLCYLGLLEAYTGGEQGPAHLAESLALARDPVGRSGAVAHLAWCPEPPPDGMRVLAEALDQADADQKADVACYYGLALAGRAMRFQPGPEHRARAAFLRARIRDEPWERPLSAMATAALTLMEGGPAARALTHARRAVADLLGSDRYRAIPAGSALRRPGGMAQMVLGQAAWTFLHADEPDEALAAVAHEAFTDGRFGHGAAEASRRYIRGLAHLRAGALREARDELEAGIRYAQISGEANTAWYAVRVTLYVETLVTQGEHAHLLELRDSPRGRSALTHLDDYQPFLLQRGRNLAALGEHHRALALIERAGALATRWHTDNPSLMPWRSEAALVRLALGERKAARDLTEEEVARARRWGAPLTLSQALVRHGRVLGEPETVEEGLALLTDRRAQCHRAHGLVLLGETLGERGHRDDAVRQLMRGYDTAVSCGAGLHAARAAAALAAAGARPRRLTGVPALTRQERLIACRAAEGATNREVAEELLLTLRTVEQHLTHVYRKLGIDGRAGLRPVLAAAGLVPPAG